MDIYQRTSLRKRCTLMPIHAERIDYIHVPAWVTTSFPQHLPNKSKLREAWFSSILSDFSLQITCCLEYFVYFCIEIHLFRRDGHFCIFPLRPILAPISHNTPPAWNKKSPTLRRPRARVLYINVYLRGNIIPWSRDCRRRIKSVIHLTNEQLATCHALNRAF